MVKLHTEEFLGPFHKVRIVLLEIFLFASEVVVKDNLIFEVIVHESAYPVGFIDTLSYCSMAHSEIMKQLPLAFEVILSENRILRIFKKFLLEGE